MVFGVSGGCDDPVGPMKLSKVFKCKKITYDSIETSEAYQSLAS